MSICQNCCDPLASLTYLKWPHAGDMTTITPGHMATGDRAITVQKESVKPADMDDDEIISFWKTPHIEDGNLFSPIPISVLRGDCGSCFCSRKRRRTTRCNDPIDKKHSLTNKFVSVSFSLSPQYAQIQIHVASVILTSTTALHESIRLVVFIPIQRRVRVRVQVHHAQIDQNVERALLQVHAPVLLLQIPLFLGRFGLLARLFDVPVHDTLY
mmetsp:Transcript_5594/g.12270  ORF Transcript_5594/g.12270 Transcript_5594/m.12270 type:complete len:213 (+) Transcript_5594:89-727(+)